MMRKVLSVVLMVALGFLGAALYAAVDRQFLHEPGSFYFDDVPTDSPHDDDIGYLFEYGITEGFADDTFRPNDLVTRQQMASFIMRSSAFDPYTSWILIDNLYFDGFFFGITALQRGDITLEEYNDFQDFLDWYFGLLDFQLLQQRGRTFKVEKVMESAKQVLARAREQQKSTESGMVSPK